MPVFQRIGPAGGANQFQRSFVYEDASALRSAQAGIAGIPEQVMAVQVDRDILPGTDGKRGIIRIGDAVLQHDQDVSVPCLVNGLLQGRPVIDADIRNQRFIIDARRWRDSARNQLPAVLLHPEDLFQIKRSEVGRGTDPHGVLGIGRPGNGQPVAVIPAAFAGSDSMAAFRVCFDVSAGNGDPIGITGDRIPVDRAAADARAAGCAGGGHRTAGNGDRTAVTFQAGADPGGTLIADFKGFRGGRHRAAVNGNLPGACAVAAADACGVHADGRHRAAVNGNRAGFRGIGAAADPRAMVPAGGPDVAAVDGHGAAVP